MNNIVKQFSSNSREFTTSAKLLLNAIFQLYHNATYIYLISQSLESDSMLNEDKIIRIYSKLETFPRLSSYLAIGLTVAAYTGA